MKKKEMTQKEVIVPHQPQNFNKINLNHKSNMLQRMKEEVMHEELFDDIKYDLKFSHSEYSELPVAEYEGTPETNGQQQTETNKNIRNK